MENSMHKDVFGLMLILVTLTNISVFHQTIFFNSIRVVTTILVYCVCHEIIQRILSHKVHRDLFEKKIMIVSFYFYRPYYYCGDNYTPDWISLEDFR
ncbi:uncharacterized protein [Musca autumnalis]|uniref:uncharacterized protein n=1 Tax=Musca autumnalis TaxID=221902 RepID=UPI003CE8DEFB